MKRPCTIPNYTIIIQKLKKPKMKNQVKSRTAQSVKAAKESKKQEVIKSLNPMQKAMVEGADQNGGKMDLGAIFIHFLREGAEIDVRRKGIKCTFSLVAGELQVVDGNGKAMFIAAEKEAEGDE
jgi:hypothetical protein